ncbi:hypothetical protein E4U17_001041 [Claviceps sp. LM77 group G4]|nr:hypothetical protein E4U17_001041 [Claviceps sp. LM77 group G4]KAG6078762.1 hypothetical protein E4U16_001456 [Claviceps sp. LM84 group G4]
MSRSFNSFILKAHGQLQIDPDQVLREALPIEAKLYEAEINLKLTIQTATPFPSSRRQDGQFTIYQG